MSHPNDQRTPTVLAYEVLITPTRQSFRTTIYLHGSRIASHVHYTFEGILRWAHDKCKEDASVVGAHHFEASIKVVSL